MRFRPHPTIIRAQYEELKQTAAYKQWRARQYKRQWGFCAYGFHRLGSPYHCDHVRAVAVGGSNSYFNFVLACAPCNLYKSAQVLTRPYEWLVRVRLFPLALLYELAAFVVMLVTGIYKTPKR